MIKMDLYLISFTQVCFVPSMVEICQVVLEKKIFKFRECIFVIISALNKSWSFICTDLNSLYPRIPSLVEIGPRVLEKKKKM